MKRRISRTEEVKTAMDYEERASYPDLTDAFSNTAGDNPRDVPAYTNDQPMNARGNDMEVIR